MKNKFFILKIFIYFFFIIFSNKILSEELIFNASEIQSLDKGNKIKAYDGIEIIDPNGIVINGDKFEYDKIKSVVKIDGNVVVVDNINDVTINSEEVIYKANRYSTLGVQKLQEQGQTSTVFKAFLHGSWSFIKHYIFKLGFLDGGPGFVIAFGNFEGTFYRYVKLMEAQENWKAPNIDPIHKAQK